MGGGNRRRPKNSNNKTQSGKGRSRADPRSSSSSSARVKNSLFVEGGFLSDWQLDSRGRNLNGSSNSGKKHDRTKASGSKSGSRRLSGNAIRYEYPSLDFEEGLHPESDVKSNGEDNKMDESHPIVLVDSNETQIVAYVDQTPPPKPHTINYNYEYSSSFVLGDSSHRGLGFYEESEATPSGMESSSKYIEEQEGACSDFSSSEKEMDADVVDNCKVDGEVAEEFPAEVHFPKRNSGFLSIGGMKLYTQDTSGVESDEDYDGESLTDESSETSDPGELEGSSESEDSEAMFDGDSDVDVEVAEDYLEGIGGNNNALDAKWLVDQALDESDNDSSSSSCFDETLVKLGGIALQEASKEYGMQKTRSKNRNSRGARETFSSTLDDLMLVKDPRTASAKKKHVTKFPRSWPSEAQKSNYSRKFPGEKKKHRKEMIAVKRRERMLRRGVDLEQVNSKLEQIVLDGVDMFCFQPMHHRDCSQVRRLAAIYRLSSGCQGSGKKRFVSVARTQHTCMPSSSDRIRLEKLIGAGDEDADFAVNYGSNINPVAAGRSRVKKVAKGSGLRPLELQQSAQSKSSRKANRNNNGEASEKKRSGKKSSYASQPVSFVSSGIMQAETIDNGDFKVTTEICESKGVAGSAEFGAFEVHTKGFGSKMMAKMGFVGGGLGRDGQGMSEPIEVIKRPKSLGLGVEFSNTSSESVARVHHDSSSESVARVHRNTSSESIARVHHKTIGSFEKHTKGFGSKMMAKMGFVEGMGLGKDSQGMTSPLVAVKLPKSRGLGARG